MFRTVTRRSQSELNCRTELVSLRFEDSTTLTVPLLPGKVLWEIVEPGLASTGRNLSTHALFLENSRTPLPLNLDPKPLVGQVVVVKNTASFRMEERVSERTKLHLAYFRRQKSRDTEKFSCRPLRIMDTVNSVSEDSDSPFRHLLSQMLVDESLSHLMSLPVPSELTLESSWGCIVHNVKDLNSKQQEMQEGIWELIVTEANYLTQLFLVTQGFVPLLQVLKRRSCLVEVDENKLFSNLDQVYNANWRVYLDRILPVLNKVRSQGSLFDEDDLETIFEDFETTFGCYRQYCVDEDSCQQYLKNICKETTNFKIFIMWWEERYFSSSRLKLLDFLMRPVQRILRYPLILKNILKRATEDNAKVKIAYLVSIMEGFAININHHLQSMQAIPGPLSVLERLEVGNPVESISEEADKVLMDYMTFNPTGCMVGGAIDEVRSLVKEGTVKVVDKSGKSDAFAVLLSDCFLLARPVKGSDRLRIVQQPCRLDNLIIRSLGDVTDSTGNYLFIYLNEFGLVITAFILQLSKKEAFHWLSKISQTKDKFRRVMAETRSPSMDLSDDNLSTSSMASSGLVSNAGIYRRTLRRSDNSMDDSALELRRPDSLCSSSSLLDAKGSDVPFDDAVLVHSVSPPLGSTTSSTSLPQMSSEGLNETVPQDAAGPTMMACAFDDSSRSALCPSRPHKFDKAVQAGDHAAIEADTHLLGGPTKDNVVRICGPINV